MKPHLIYPYKQSLFFYAYFAIYCVLVMDSRKKKYFIFPDFTDKTNSSKVESNSKMANMFNYYAN